MIIGIDLGTTNSVAAYMKDGESIVIKNKEGNNTTPSVVSYLKNGNIICGKSAKDKKTDPSCCTVWSVKRFMGLKYHELKDEDRDLPYQIVRHNDDEIVIDTSFCGKVTPVQISAEILGKIKTDCEDALGCSVNQAVITVPAYFSDNQREATRKSGEIAGLEVVSIISEPTAAALAYNGAEKQENQTIAVYDLGGGTFDISILRFENGLCRVLSTNGDTHLGGDDIDRRIQDYFVSCVARLFGRNLKEELNNPQLSTNAKLCLKILRFHAEKAKIYLCENPQATYETTIDDFSNGESLVLKLSYKNFENISRFVTDATLKCCSNALSDAGLTKGQIDKVLLVGGSTKSPVVKEAVKSFFEKEPKTSVNPDEAVAQGAAIQGAILEGKIKDVRLADVTPLTLGIMAKNDVFIPLIKRNTTIPCSITKTFTNSTDTGVINFPICQGEKGRASSNTRVGIICINDVKEKAGDARISITFSIDKNGIVQVDALNEKNSSKQSIKLHRKAV